MWRSKRQVVIGKVVVVGWRGWRLILELVGVFVGSDAEALWAEVAAVLAPIGLRLSDEKTRVCL